MAKARVTALRVWIPEIYGQYLVFVDDLPVGCVPPAALPSDRALTVGELPPELFAGSAHPPDTEVDLVVIDPSRATVLDQPTADRFIPAFYRYFGQVFHTGSIFIDSDADFLPVLERYFPAGGARGLDVGAGSGKYTLALARRMARVVGCDLEIGRLVGLRGSIDVVQADIQHLPFADHAFDFAMCNFVLEHVGDPYRVASEMIRVVRPGGTLLLAVPSFSVRDVVAAQKGELPTLNFEHLRAFTGRTGVHPWEEPTERLVAHVAAHCAITEVRGVNITAGLTGPLLDEVVPTLDLPRYASTAKPPWNLLGQQTMIHAERRS